jgi:general L-amino acid transport system substrate-binding protein
VLALLLLAAPARAESMLEHVRATNTLVCAAETRPGFANEDAEGDLHGLAVELCHAVAVAVLGPAGKFEITSPDADIEFDELGHKPPDLAFFSAGLLADHHLISHFIPGPTVFIDPVTAMVPDASPVQQQADLAGKTICVMIGSTAQRALEARLGAASPPIVRLTFREEVEMLDAYNVGRCDAMADDASTLAGYRLTTGINRMQSRLLTPPLALTPVLAVTPSGDGAWAGLTGWLLHDIIADAAPKSAWRSEFDLSTGALRQGWRDDVHTAVGTYADMQARTMGNGSRFNLPVWPNAPWPDGLLVPGGVE